MAFLGIGKKKEDIDYTEKYNNKVDSATLGKSRAALARIKESQKNPISSAASLNQPSAGSSASSDVDSALPFFGNFSSSGSSGLSSIPSTSFSNDSDYLETGGLGVNAEEKKQRLAKRLITMTEQIEELSNQMYHLQQRLEVMEKKLSLGERY